MNTRLRIFTLAFFLMILLLIARLFYWQVIKGEELSDAARTQYQGNKTIGANRGSIRSSDLSWLATSAQSFLLYAEIPNLKEPPKKIADELAPITLQLNEENYSDNSVYQTDLVNEINRIYLLLTRESAVWVPLQHKLTRQQKEKIDELAIDGIGYEQEESRVYPEASTAAHLLGFVGKNKDGQDEGYFGLEGFYNLSLTGRPGFLSRESDAKGIPLLFGSSREIPAIEGMDLVTNIDKAVQIDLEQKLKDGIKMYGAKGGTAIVVEPKTGNVVAMSSYPSYDPKDYYDFSDELFKDPAISDSFEPGSVFKIIVMASALDAGLVEPDTKCDICSGPAKVDKYYIETWNQQYFPDSTMTDVIVHSDNVGMVFVADKLGIDRMHDYLTRFGIGNLTGIDLQGEASPKLRDKKQWSIVDLATAGFGQGIAVTPIQMVKAVSAIANKGRMSTPHVVSKIVHGDTEEDVVPEQSDPVISEKAASEVTEMMVEAAKYGESKWTYLKGFGVAGKTGTAQIPIAGHYDEEKTIASFIGFAPYDNPKFVMMVTLREPQTSPWASETAAPLWYSIAKDLFIHFGIQPKN